MKQLQFIESRGMPILWQGVSGVNNPCPVGYHTAGETELDKRVVSEQQLRLGRVPP
jgi:hypothetical protein